MMRTTTLFLVLLTACAPGATVDEIDPMYERYEAPSFENACSSDAACMASGCSGEVCAAESVGTTCELVEVPAGQCGCLESECVWQSRIE